MRRSKKYKKVTVMNCTTVLRSLFLLSLVCVAQSAIAYPPTGVAIDWDIYKCPAIGAPPVQVQVNYQGFIGVRRSEKRTLCTLTRLTSLTNTSSVKAADWTLVPVARSYRNNTWENVPGPYVSDLKINCNDYDIVCTLQIPIYKDAQDNTKFVLTTTTHDISDRERVARFLEQATFGPTGKDIQRFNITRPLQTQFAKWIKDQMNRTIVSPTYHREYFRRRADNSFYLGRSTLFSKPRHPCSVDSRWRKHSFNSADYGYILTVQNTSNGKFLLSVEGVPRTIISEFKDTAGNSLTVGDYEFCWWTMEYVGGTMTIKPRNTNSCVELKGGNPALSLTQDILTTFNMTIRTLALPSRSFFTEVDRVLFGFKGPDFFGGHGYTLTVSLSDRMCQTLPRGDFGNLIGILPDGEQFYSDARIILDENTIENPLVDSGGPTAGTTLCPNVPKTFLNLDSCVLSTAPTACSPERVNPRIFLNETTIRMLYQGSGRFVYTIRRLQLTPAYSPCKPGVRHRWMKLINVASCTTSGISASTTSALIGMINDLGWDENSIYVDIHLEWDSFSGVYKGNTCDSSNSKTVGMMLNVSGVCHQHVHPDEGSVYDFTYWTRPNTHPGNAIAESLGKQNPIKLFAYNNTFSLTFPSSHTIDRWENNKKYFDLIGRLYDSVAYVDLPSSLKTKGVADLFNPPGTAPEAVVVCGSRGEIANDPSLKNVFSFTVNGVPKDSEPLSRQKQNAWSMIVLAAQDQLRQRMAWALSQLLVVTPNQINEDGLSEAYLNYYDIFVHNAFGNYRDILKEVSQSPMMAEMLSFLDSKSSAYVLRTNNLKAWPDENFAREVMQLFTIGVYQLNIDGTPKISSVTGLPIPTYDNGDIQTFARAWTGFMQQPRRGNIENWDWYPNRIDPMDINPRWRDVFPKRDLYDGYIGDSYPLCSDLPPQQFLKAGAKYFLLGSSPLPEYQSGDEGWAESWWIQWRGPSYLTRLSLSPSSALYNVLCNPGPDGGCRFKSIVQLNSSLICQGIECNLDSVRTVRVSANPPIYYEYIRPSCVELSFYNMGKKVQKNESPDFHVICANTAVDVALEACCQNCGWWGCGGSVFCNFSGERVQYSTAGKRCKNNSKFRNGDMCDWTWIDSSYSNPGCTEYAEDDNYYWTNQNCTVKVKVDTTGKVAIVHDANSTEIVFPYYSSSSENYFPVSWDGNRYPSVTNSCGSGQCTSINGICVCNVVVFDNSVFSSVPSRSAIMYNLTIGSPPPSWYGSIYSLTESSGGVDVYQWNGTGYNTKTIFGLVNDRGEKIFFRNMRSTVVIGSGVNTFRFRNPPHFVNFIIPDTRDVIYETEAVLDHYFYHDNTAPFIARRIIQRFGISNPSPRFVKTAAMAFKTGLYVTSDGVTFGDGKYGNLGAMVAAILLDREARSIVLDTDPSFGSLREPMIKLIAFMRAMNFESRSDVRELAFVDLSNTIGEAPHGIPNVFSFFLPDYAPSGIMKDASLVAPEAQVQTSPTFLGFVNGMISLVDLGLSDCYGGFGQTTTWWCPNYNNRWYDSTFSKEDHSEGFLHYVPRSFDPAEIADELALLLTSGRLNTASRHVIADMINYAPTFWDGIRIAQKVIIASPQFHSTGVVTAMRTEREDMVKPEQSDSPYKAVVFVMLDGGMDSYNILMPHSGCTGKDLYAEYKTIRGELALSKNDLRQIDATTSLQPCNIFGVHPDLKVVQQLYNDGDLAFVANVGVLQEYVNKTDYWQKTTKTALFAHNTQHDEVAYVDIFDEKAGLGVCGRMVDVAHALGYKTGALSVNGVSEALIAKLTPLFVVSPTDFEKVNPIPWTEDVTRVMKLLNKANKVGSSLFSETWSDLLFKALGENDLLFEAFMKSSLNVQFPDTWLSYQFEGVAKLVDTKDTRGTDRDVFYVETGGFDTHSNMIQGLSDRATEINDALEAFVNEMKSKGRWNDVVLVFVSEFARTLTPNTSSGSDHAWGGNYFVAGGDVNGGKIFGKYISDFTENSPINFNPGIVIPTTSWDQVWEPIAKWYGITTASGLDEVIPSRKKFAGPLNGLFN